MYRGVEFSMAPLPGRYAIRFAEFDRLRRSLEAQIPLEAAEQSHRRLHISKVRQASGGLNHKASLAVQQLLKDRFEGVANDVEIDELLGLLRVSRLDKLMHRLGVFVAGETGALCSIVLYLLAGAALLCLVNPEPLPCQADLTVNGEPYKLAAPAELAAGRPPDITLNGQSYLRSETCYRHWSFVQGLYFVVVTLSAVGYGDLKAYNDGAKIFVAFYIVLGMGLVVNVASGTLATVLTERHAKVVSSVKEDPKAQLLTSTLSRGLSGGVGLLAEATGSMSPSSRRRKRRLVFLSPMYRSLASSLVLAIGIYGVVLLAGAGMVHEIEGWTWSASFYWAVITTAKVGYGDLTPTAEVSRILTAVYIVVGIGLLGFAVNAVSSAHIEMVTKRKELEILRKPLSLEMIAELDWDGNGVDSGEFLAGMLVAYEKVTLEEIAPILRRFTELDIDGSGFLTERDLEVFKHQQMTQGSIHMEERGSLGGGMQLPTKLPPPSAGATRGKRAMQTAATASMRLTKAKDGLL